MKQKMFVAKEYNKALFVFMIKVFRPVNELLNIIHKDKVAYFAFAFACST